MTERDFVYWLNGFLEVSKPETLNKDQLDQIKKHIALVLKRVVDEPQYKLTYTPDPFGGTRVC